MIRKFFYSSHLLLFVVIASLLLLSGCGSSMHAVKMDDTFVPKVGTKIEVGPVTNESGYKFDFDVTQLLMGALADELRDKNLLWAGGDSSGHHLTLTTSIVDYEEGNAFKRWLMPGWGETLLVISGSLKDGDRSIGTVKSRETVSFGGGYTVGAWKAVFTYAAKNIVNDLHEKIPK